MGEGEDPPGMALWWAAANADALEALGGAIASTLVSMRAGALNDA